MEFIQIFNEDRAKGRLNNLLVYSMIDDRYFIFQDTWDNRVRLCHLDAEVIPRVEIKESVALAFLAKVLKEKGSFIYMFDSYIKVLVYASKVLAKG